MEIAPGIRRLGKGLVNVYLLEEAGGVTIIDAGAPGYWRDVSAELAAMGRTSDDVRALLLTHAHADHVGFAVGAAHNLQADWHAVRGDPGANRRSRLASLAPRRCRSASRRGWGLPVARRRSRSRHAAAF